MLEKNKDYVEFTLQSTCVNYGKIKDHLAIDFHGYSDSDFPGVPMDVVCKRSGHRVVMISKRDFEALQTENEQLKKKLEEFSPVPGYKDFLKALYPDEDVEKIVYVTEQLCCGRDLQHALQTDLENYKSVSSVQAESIRSWKKATGFSSVEEIKDYLVNKAECNTLREAIASLEYNVKFARDERRDMSKKLEECEKDYISERDKVTVLEKELKILTGALQEWKKGTGCPSPSAAKTLIESLKADLRKSNSTMLKELDQCIDDWQKATGCDTPGAVKKLIDNLAKKAINYENRLNRAKQSASIAIRHLDNIVFRDDKYPDWTDKMVED